jgi:hypothetical protein
MIADHHARTAGRATLLARAADEILGTHRLVTTGELSGTLGPHVTDGPAGWWIDLGAVGPSVPAHAKAGTAVCGTRSDLLLWLTNRRSPGSVGVTGRHELVDGWKQLRR